MKKRVKVKGDKNMTYYTSNVRLLLTVDKLCDKLTGLHNMKWKHGKDAGAHFDYKVGKKYIKIISYDNADKGGASVWGFINIADFKKGLAGITFLEGDVLKASGWATPALNRPRGNIYDGYTNNLDDRNLYGPGYIRGYFAGAGGLRK